MNETAVATSGSRHDRQEMLYFPYNNEVDCLQLNGIAYPFKERDLRQIVDLATCAYARSR